MKRLFKRMWKDEGGVLTFEWILLITVLTIGVVGALSAVRDAIIDELSDVAQAMLALDQSYSIIQPVEVTVHDAEVDGAAGSRFIDGMTFNQCRLVGFPGAVGKGNRSEAQELSQP